MRNPESSFYDSECESFTDQQRVDWYDYDSESSSEDEITDMRQITFEMEDVFADSTAYVIKMMEMMQLEHRDIHKKEYKIEQHLPDERVYTYYQDDQLKLWRREKFPKQKKKEN